MSKVKISFAALRISSGGRGEVTHSGLFFSLPLFICNQSYQDTAVVCIMSCVTLGCEPDVSARRAPCVCLSVFLFRSALFFFLFQTRGVYFLCSSPLHARLCILQCCCASTKHTLLHLLGLDSLHESNSHKAQRPCRPYGATQSAGLYYTALHSMASTRAAAN